MFYREEESELIAGYFTEYSGMKMGLFMFAEFIEIAIIGALFTTLFLGGYNLPYMKTPNGTMIFSQDGEPVSLFCADETDGNSFRACGLIFSSLYNFSTTSIPEPDLAEECTANDDATEWTCTLKQGVVFSNGAAFDANDVVATFSAGMDYNYPLRKGNTGSYQYFKDLFGPKVLNQPAE